MDILIKIWQITLKSNLFNFILMLMFLGWIIKKFNLADVLENGRKQIEDNIHKAKQEKINSEKEFFKTRSETKNVEKEANEIVKHSEENAVLVGENLVKTAEIQSESYSKNIDKIIDDKIKILRKNLTNDTAQKSISIAKNHIENLLNNDRQLHLKYITESVEALKGMEL